MSSSSNNQKRTMANPPRIFHNFLRWFCDPKLLKHIEGDLLELYDERVKAKGKRRADLRFVWDVLLLFRPGIIKSFEGNRNLNQYGMFKNYLTISWRNIIKNKVFSTINVFGLAIGLAACVLILQFVVFEKSFDQFNSKLDRTYRVTNDRFQHGKLIQHGTITYPTIGPTMAKDFPEIEEFVRVMPAGELNARIDDRNFRGEGVLLTDARFFKVFDYKLLVGDRSTILNEPFKAVLTESIARKFFQFEGDDLNKLLGKTFRWGLDERPYELQGILQDMPLNSHIQFNVLISYTSLTTSDPDAESSWTWSDMYHYLVLKPGTDPKSLETKFTAFSERYFQGDKVSGSIEKFHLQPLKEAHLYSDYEYDFASVASGKAVWSMLIVAVFILVIAWINYINLTTSRAIDRAKEVGVRKVMGAFKVQLVNQFILESLLITFLAMALAIVIISVLQVPFNKLVGSELSWQSLINQLNARQVLIIILLLIGGAIISGFYPAFILSRYQPVTVLKGKFTRSTKGNFLRKALVMFQFTASAVLITITIIVSRQLEFMNTADLGINLKDVLVVRAPELEQFDSTFIKRIEDFKNEVNTISGVVQATSSSRLPGNRLGRAFNIRLADQPATMNYTMSNVGINYDFFKTMDVKILAGRDFLPTDHRINFDELKSVIVNQNAINLLGMKNPEEAIGKEIIWSGDGKIKYTIIGVVQDFHQEALQKPMEPIVFRPTYNTYGPISVRIEKTDKTQLIELIESTYKKHFAGNSFEYYYLQDSYNNQYSDDTRFGKVVSIFTILAIIVACLGLIGLSSYTALMRTKEIGVRKVLGASVTSIVSILSVDFVKLVLMASVISLPIAYYVINQWLQSYTYKIELSWLLFLVPIVIVITIATITICGQVLKTALTKPVDTLRYE